MFSCPAKYEPSKGERSFLGFRMFMEDAKHVSRCSWYRLAQQWKLITAALLLITVLLLLFPGPWEGKRPGNSPSYSDGLGEREVRHIMKEAFLGRGLSMICVPGRGRDHTE